MFHRIAPNFLIFPFNKTFESRLHLCDFTASIYVYLFIFFSEGLASLTVLECPTRPVFYLSQPNPRLIRLNHVLQNRAVFLRPNTAISAPRMVCQKRSAMYSTNCVPRWRIIRCDTGVYASYSIASLVVHESFQRSPV
jgi:hypothetical protein